MSAWTTEELRRKRAASFGEVATDYERSRPGYPEEAARWVAGDRPVEVLDVAAGTGKLTVQLHDLGHSVVALEPSAKMLDQLQRRRGGIAAVNGPAEALPFGPRSFDTITVAQAFHWFDHAVATAEFARVLRPGGRVGLLWNLRDESVHWVAELSRLIGSGSERSQGHHDEGSYDPFASSQHFGPLTNRTFRFEQPLDRDVLTGLVRSRSYVATLSEEEQKHVFERVVRLCEEHPALAGRSRFPMPYRTVVFCAERIR